MSSSKYILPACIAGAAFFALAASSPQCARTHDAVTSPSVGTMADGNPCVQGCIDLFQQGMRDERARFKAAIQECNGDSTCIAQQEEIHESTIQELQADKGSCLDNCGHEQGGATSGQ